MRRKKELNSFFLKKRRRSSLLIALGGAFFAQPTVLNEKGLRIKVASFDETEPKTDFYDMAARGLQNNNPLNLVKGGDPFWGEIIPSKDDRFRQFKDMPHGYRAGFVTLGTYLTKHNRNTIDRILHAWAPPFENDTTGYVRMGEQWAGIGKEAVLTARSGEEYIRIVAAMSRVENGTPAVMADVEAGFDLQSKITR